MAKPSRKTLGNRVAPPRFLLFAAVLLVAVPIAACWIEPRLALLAGFDIAAIAFLVSTTGLLRAGDAERMRRHSAENDANRLGLLLLTALIGAVILATIASLLGDRGVHGRFEVTLVVATLALAWLFANTVFAFHYAHLFYRDEGGGGLDFPAEKEPDYWDFLYFSFTLGMTFQTSDVTVTGRSMRRIVLLQSVVAFAFNIGILAFVINTLGG